MLFAFGVGCQPLGSTSKMEGAGCGKPIECSRISEDSDLRGLSNDSNPFMHADAEFGRTRPQIS
jgi:hypothetical protein